MVQEQFNQLFVERTMCLLYNLSDTDNHCGWVGGNAPAYFDDKQDLLNESGKKYHFYMTIISPINDKMVSIFLPTSELYLNDNIYPKCSIKVFEHEVFPESQYGYYEMFTKEPLKKKTKYQKEFDYSKPTIKKTFLSEARLVSKTTEETALYFIQVGGNPFLIQEEPYYSKNLSNDGYQFFLSIDENGYLSDMIHGNCPLNFGAAYLYAKMGSNTITNVVAGFWQFS